MKMILQKHTSKFVAGLFNSLGITACVSLTSCGGENKVKQTENQGEKLKNKLKTVDFYKSLAEDEGSLKTIAEWLNNKNYGSDYILTAKDLQEIFQNDSSKLNEVAEKLGVILTESDDEPDDEPDDEKKKEINEWLNKLNSLNDDVFNALDKDLKEKVAQKFIDNKMDVDNDSDIKAKLAGFINEVVVAKKESEITLKIEGEGKVIITKVADNTTTDFVFDKIKNLQGFVENLKDKEITKIEGKWSFVFAENNVKICGHQTGFKVTDCFEEFLNCLNTLVGVEKLNVQKLSLKIAQSKLSLNEVECSDDYFKNVGFWTLVKDHAALFGITDESKFEIEKKSNEGDVVKIGEFVTQLKWSEVVEGENTFKTDSKWGNIFKLKSKEESAKEVTVEFKAEGNYSLNKGGDVELKTLEHLTTFVGGVKDKTVKCNGDKKFEFIVKDGKTINVKVDKLVNFDINLEKGNFSALLGYVGDLKSVGLVEKSFVFKVEADSENNAIKFGDVKVTNGFLITEDAWKAIKSNGDLFYLGEKGVEVETGEKKDQHVRIGSLELAFNVLNSGKNAIDNGWENIFTLKG